MGLLTAVSFNKYYVCQSVCLSVCLSVLVSPIQFRLLVPLALSRASMVLITAEFVLQVTNTAETWDIYSQI